MPALTKCVYGLETDPKKTPFALLNNQYRLDNIIQNAGWFNGKGERVGTGDLSLKDMQRVAKNISSSEIFIALTEFDSGVDLPSNLDRTAPGIPYVLTKASWVMARLASGEGMVLRIRNDITKTEDATKDGINYIRIPRGDLYKAFGFDPKTGKILPLAPPAPQKDVPRADDAKANPSVKASPKNPTGKMSVSNMIKTGVIPKVSSIPTYSKPSAGTPIKKSTASAVPIAVGTPIKKKKSISP